MKKYIKIFFICMIGIITLELIFFIGRTIRNYTFINEIKNKGKDILTSPNYKFVKELNTENGYNAKDIMYYKDGICKTETYNNGELAYINWKDYNTNEVAGEFASLSSDDTDYLVTIKTGYFVQEEPLEFNFVQTLKSEGDYYVTGTEGMVKKYFDKKTKELKKAIFLGEADRKISEYTFKIEYNIVTDADVEKPE